MTDCTVGAGAAVLVGAMVDGIVAMTGAVIGCDSLDAPKSSSSEFWFSCLVYSGTSLVRKSKTTRTLSGWVPKRIALRDPPWIGKVLLKFPFSPAKSTTRRPGESSEKEEDFTPAGKCRESFGCEVAAEVTRKRNCS